MTSRLVVATAILLASCKGSPTGGEKAPRPTMTVQGSMIHHHVQDDGSVVDAPADLRAARFTAFDSGRRAHTVLGAEDGTFAIAGVPEGTYTLRHEVGREGFYTTTNSPTVALGSYVLGRVTQALPTQPTTLAFAVDGLAPWASDHSLQFFATGANSFIFALELFLSPPPSASATSLGGATVDLALVRANLIDGDVARLGQLVTTTANGITYWHLARAATSAPFTITDGGSQTISATLTDVAQDQQVQMQRSSAAFASYDDDVGPMATNVGDAFGVFAQPGGLAYGEFSSSPDLLVAIPPAQADFVGSFSFGNPYPPSWSLVVWASTEYVAWYTAPGADFEAPLYVHIGAAWPLTALPSPQVPAITPVRELTVNGQSAYVDRSGVSTSPVLEWRPPALGSAQSYRVFVYQLVNDLGDTYFDEVAVIQTRATRLTLPPRALQPGSSYAFVVTAYDYDFTQNPSAGQPVPGAWASAVTGRISTAFSSGGVAGTGGGTEPSCAEDPYCNQGPDTCGPGPGNTDGCSFALCSCYVPGTGTCTARWYVASSQYDPPVYYECPDCDCTGVAENMFIDCQCASGTGATGFDGTYTSTVSGTVTCEGPSGPYTAPFSDSGTMTVTNGILSGDQGATGSVASDGSVTWTAYPSAFTMTATGTCAPNGGGVMCSGNWTGANPCTGSGTWTASRP